MVKTKTTKYRASLGFAFSFATRKASGNSRGFLAGDVMDVAILSIKELVFSNEM